MKCGNLLFDDIIIHEEEEEEEKKNEQRNRGKKEPFYDRMQSNQNFNFPLGSDISNRVNRTSDENFLAIYRRYHESKAINHS